MKNNLFIALIVFICLAVVPLSAQQIYEVHRSSVSSSVMSGGGMSVGGAISAEPQVQLPQAQQYQLPTQSRYSSSMYEPFSSVSPSGIRRTQVRGGREGDDEDDETNKNATEVGTPANEYPLGSAYWLLLFAIGYAAYRVVRDRKMGFEE